MTENSDGAMSEDQLADLTDETRPTKWPSAAEINAKMSRSEAVQASAENDAAELKARDADVVAAEERNPGGKKKPVSKGDAVGSPQGTLDVVKASTAATKIAHAWLAARDVGKKVSAFKKQLMSNLDIQLAADKTDFIEVDGVRFNRQRLSEIAVGAFDDWTPKEDSTEALLNLLGVSADDIGAPTDPGEKPAPKKDKAAKKESQP